MRELEGNERQAVNKGSLQLNENAQGSFSKIVVLGASGFIGRQIVVELAALHKHTIFSVSRSSHGGELTNLAGEENQIEEVLFGCDDQTALQAFFQTHKPDYVINCIAHGTKPQLRESGLCFDINTGFALSAFVEASNNNCKRFIHLGTCEEYGNHENAIAETAETRPEGPYGISKLAGTLLLQNHAKQVETELVLVRPFGTWGEGEAAHRLVPTIIAHCVQNRKIPLSDGYQVRDFACVNDVAKAIVELAFLPKNLDNETFNIGSGKPIRVRDFVKQVASYIDGENLLEFGALERRNNEMASMVPDMQKLNKFLGWLPQSVNEKVVFAMRDAAISRNLSIGEG